MAIGVMYRTLYPLSETFTPYLESVLERVISDFALSTCTPETVLTC